MILERKRGVTMAVTIENVVEKLALLTIDEKIHQYDVEFLW